jgi:site-specific recombinase XerC
MELVSAWIEPRVRRGELRPASAALYRKLLGSLVRRAGCPPDGEGLRAWLERPGLRPASRAMALSVARAWCRWLVEQGHLAADPTEGLRAPRPTRRIPRALPPSAVRRVLAAADGWRDRLAVSLMVCEGLRIGEVCRLRLADVDTTGGTVVVEGKGGHERVVPLTRHTAALLARRVAEGPASPWAVPSLTRPGRPLSPATLGQRVARLMAAAGVKRGPWDGVSAHALRHTCAADVLRAGAHVRDVQRLLGHASLATTERYLPLVVGDLAAHMERRAWLSTAPTAARRRSPGPRARR